MKDLKYRIYFEQLLSDVKNELVDQALANDQLALGIPAISCLRFC